jgi:hypothetical protein
MAGHIEPGQWSQGLRRGEGEGQPGERSPIFVGPGMAARPDLGQWSQGLRQGEGEVETTKRGLELASRGLGPRGRLLEELQWVWEREGAG